MGSFSRASQSFTKGGLICILALQSGESSDDVQLRVGLGGVAGGEEERGEKAIKTESGCHCSDDVPKGAWWR
jgi:hypothetical protein